MPAFAGFPPGKNPFVPLPEQFFASILPEVEDIGEIKLTLHLFWLLARKAGTPRCVSDRELLADPLLRRTLRRAGDPRPHEERLRAALELALARGTLLRVRARVDHEIVGWYFFNTEKSREAVTELLNGDLSPEVLLEVEGPAGGDPEGRLVALEIERPSIFTLYEQNIGMLPPLLAEELREADEQYPAEWVEEAFRLAMQQNKRRWSYIRAILKRWEQDGRGEQAHGAHG